MHARRHQDARGLRFAVGAHRHERSFRHRRGAVVHRRVRHVHAGQARDHGLEFVDELQRALARLSLVGRVGAVEFPARGNRPHGGRDVVLVGAGADEVQRHARRRRARSLMSRPTCISFSRLRDAARATWMRSSCGISSNSSLDAARADGREHRRRRLRRVGNEGHQPPSASSDLLILGRRQQRGRGAAPAAGFRRISHPRRRHRR